MKTPKNTFWKFALMGLISLLLLIPLAMVKDLIRERSNRAQEASGEVAGSWGGAQTLEGPTLVFSYVETSGAGDKKKEETKKNEVYPSVLNCEYSIDNQLLHRSIYDIPVYTADVNEEGTFIVPESMAQKEKLSLTATIKVSDLRGIDGPIILETNGKQFTADDGNSGTVRFYIKPGDIPMDGSTIPFKVSFKVRGSSSISFKPYGDETKVIVKSNCPNPSFNGDFLPVGREIDENGFSAEWRVSKINRGAPSESRMGVSFLPEVSQYQQSERSAKYGLLIIVLVFAAGLMVELVGKKKIALVQYLIIGLSLVLFYALTLSFSEFISFGLSYLIAAAMTTAALLGYFRGILKSRAAYTLALLVAVTYALCYILLQMGTYALLTGSLVLFVVLAVIMYYTAGIEEPDLLQQKV